MFQLGEYRTAFPGGLVLLVLALDGLHILPDLFPTADKDGVHRLPPLFAGSGLQVLVQFRKKLEHRPDVLLGKGLFPVFQFSKLAIGQKELQQAEEHRLALGLPLFELGDGGRISPLPLPQEIQALAQGAGERLQDTVLDRGVLQDVPYLVGHPRKERQVLRLRLGVVPQGPLVHPVFDRGERRGLRVPPAGGDLLSIGLAGKEIRVQAVAQLVGEEPAHHLIPLLPGGELGDDRVPSVDVDGQVVGTGRVGSVGLPSQVDPHRTAGAIPFCLGGGDILKVEGQQPGGEKLPVADFPPPLLDQLFYFLVIDSRHGSVLLTPSSAVWVRTPGPAPR